MCHCRLTSSVDKHFDCWPNSSTFQFSFFDVLRGFLVLHLVAFILHVNFMIAMTELHSFVNNKVDVETGNSIDSFEHLFLTIELHFTRFLPCMGAWT